MDEMISFSEFSKFFYKNGVWHFSGLIVKQQSVWLGVFDGCINESDRQVKLDEMITFLSSVEFEQLTKHSKKDPMLPLLTFPCTKKELREFILWAIDVGHMHRDECVGDVKKLISCSESAEKIVEKGLRDGLTKEVIAKKVDECFDGEDRITDKALGQMLAGGRALSDDGYITLARRSRKIKK